MIYIFMVATIRHAFVQCTRVFQILDSTSFLILGSPSPSTWGPGGGDPCELSFAFHGGEGHYCPN